MCESGHPLPGSWSKGRSRKYAYYRSRNRECKNNSIRKEALEKEICSVLNTLRPKPEIAALFKSVVLDIWKQKNRDSESLLKTFDGKARKLEDRRERLVEMLLYNKSDQQTYQLLMDKLHKEFAVTEFEKNEAKL